VIGSLVVGVAGLVISVLALLTARRWGRLTAEAAKRSAEAAERANLISQRALDLQELRQSFDLSTPSNSATAAVQGESPDSAARQDVQWVVEHPVKNRYVLRNIGTTVAEGVHVEEMDTIARQLPDDAVVQPGASAEFLLLGGWGKPVPNEVWVRWKGQDRPVAVALPGSPGPG
jgi:hypothetical protein